MSHTYTAHVTFLADSDEQALRLAEVINKLTGAGIPVSVLGKPLLTTTAMHLTYSLDYAEVIEPDLLCSQCGGPSDDRVRVGDGTGWCRKCVAEQGRALYEMTDDDAA